MPVPTSTDDLLDLLRKSELVAPARLEAFYSEHGDRLPHAPRDLVKYLIAHAVLTQFQGDQLLQGKWRGFTLGKYRVLERIGSGGMGTVYLCEHQMVGRKVAVKVLPTAQADNPASLGRFYREARAAGVLDHPNLVKAHDIDQDGGLHFLVMDYVDGVSLQALVARGAPLPVGRAVDYARQAAVGLSHAFASGLVHRDIKPANIMLERNGMVRVLDLGLARFFNDHTDMLTVKYDDKHVLGTADYVAPEQALNSHDVDTRADIYSLGCTLYFCLTGRPPFPDGKIAQKLIWHQVRQPAAVETFRDDVPPAVLAVLAKMMQKEPADRYQTPAEAAEALAGLGFGPADRPTDDEMPKLCPAALAAGGGPTATRKVPAGRKSSTQTSVPMQDSGRVASIDRIPSAADMATPRTLGVAPTRTEHPRPAPPVPPSRYLEDAPADAGSTGLVLLLAGLTLAGACIGVALTL
ncbi:MAG: serine/threonine-protein kinase, partial [Gemmataceae bacterium]